MKKSVTVWRVTVEIRGQFGGIVRETVDVVAKNVPSAAYKAQGMYAGQYRRVVGVQLFSEPA